MTIQDFAIQVSTDDDLTGASSNFLPYQASSGSVQIGTTQNARVDIGLGDQLVMEFEVTEAFTGYSAANAIPHLIPCVAIADDSALATNVTILGALGFTLGVTSVEGGLQPSDSAVLPNLFLGDKYYVHIPGAVFGHPWIGTGGVRDDKATPPGGQRPGQFYIGAYYWMPMRTGQAVQQSNPALWTATNFTAGKMSTRLLINQPVSDGVHHYLSKMVVQ